VGQGICSTGPDDRDPPTILPPQLNIAVKQMTTLQEAGRPLAGPLSRFMPRGPRAKRRATARAPSRQPADMLETCMQIVAEEVKAGRGIQGILAAGLSRSGYI